MIYAIRAIGTEFIKFGRTYSVKQRIKSLETACPHDLRVEAASDWPDFAETTIHVYLHECSVRGEWFRDGEKAQKLVAWMREPNGHAAFHAEFVKTRRPNWVELLDLKPRRQQPPALSMEAGAKADERYNSIKQRDIARRNRKAAKRSQEAISQSTG